MTLYSQPLCTEAYFNVYSYNLFHKKSYDHNIMVFHIDKFSMFYTVQCVLYLIEINLQKYLSISADSNCFAFFSVL